MRKKRTKEERKMIELKRLNELSMYEVNKIVALVKSGTPLIVAQRQIRRKRKKKI